MRKWMQKASSWIGHVAVIWSEFCDPVYFSGKIDPHFSLGKCINIRQNWFCSWSYWTNISFSKPILKTLCSEISNLKPPIVTYSLTFTFQTLLSSFQKCGSVEKERKRWAALRKLSAFSPQQPQSGALEEGLPSKVSYFVGVRNSYFKHLTVFKHIFRCYNLNAKA